MARGWGRSEEDLAADKEAARDEQHGRPKRLPAEDSERRARIHTIELSLARIAEQLARTTHPERRRALEAAREDLAKEREKLG